ncbi:MAG: TM0106 family RecB-like putative nuclease [Patescibacteria group bacterium]
MTPRHPLTASQFLHYEFCPNWVWLDAHGDHSRRAPMSGLMEKLLEQGVVHEQHVVTQMQPTEVSTRETAAAAEETMHLMHAGAEAIHGGVLTAVIDGRQWIGRPDLLLRRSGDSAFGRYCYEAVEIKSSHEMKPVQRLQLTFYSILLQEVQGTFPPRGGIITIQGERLYFDPHDTIDRFTARRREIERILDGKEPGITLTRGCLQSPWAAVCLERATEARDISLLYNIDRLALDLLRRNNIHTLEDAALMDPALIPHVPGVTPTRLAHIRLQAASFLHNTVEVVREPHISKNGLLIHFDIEADPLVDTEYLFGFLIEGGTEDTYVNFLAKQPGDESAMWHQFLQWLETLPEQYTIYHYAPYEKHHVMMLAKKYGSTPALERFQQNLVDLFEIAQRSVIFPLSFYSLKDICKYLGFSWRNNQGSGTQSIFWYERWLETGDHSALEECIRYNEDDVRASAFLRRWLENHSTQQPTQL